MKNNRKIIISVIFLIMIISICAFLGFLNSKNAQMPNKNDNQVSENYEKEYEEMKNNSIMYYENSTLEQLKEEYKITGPDDIYQIETERDGRKVITIKPSIEYKVAFCGMIKKVKPEFSEIDSIFEENNPTKNGVWIKLTDRKKIIKYLNNNEFLKSEYKINEEGYLEILKNNNATDIDKKIEKIINGNKQYIFCISSICYMIDAVTGEIVDNPYNELEEYQTYEYFKDEGKMIVFITENKEAKMTNDEIFESIIDLINLQS